MAPLKTNGATSLDIEVVDGVPVLKPDVAAEIGEVRTRVGKVDGVVAQALRHTQERFKRFRAPTDKYIRDKGLSDEVAELTDRLNRTGLKPLPRLLLGSRDIYAFLLLQALDPKRAREADRKGSKPSSGGGSKPSSGGGGSRSSGASSSSGAGARSNVLKASGNKSGANQGKAASGGGSSIVVSGFEVQPDDPQGLFDAVVRGLEGAPRSYFEGTLVRLVLAKNDIEIDFSGQERPHDRYKYRRILNKVRESGIALDQGVAEMRILEIHKEIAEPGGVPEIVDAWATEWETDTGSVVPVEVRERMVRELNGLAVDFTNVDPAQQQAYLAVAYSHATRVDGGDDADPVGLVRPQGAITPWDFQVEQFEEAEVQGVVPENIRAAGALDYVYYLGEVLGVYRLTDALVLRWASGLVDIVDEEMSSKLYRYWQLRDDRLSPEDKGMLYKRVLNKGDQELLSRMVVNESFPNLWHKLMSQVAEYIQTATEAPGGTVSRVPIERATQELQYNLSEHMVGMGQIQVTDMYMQLRQAFEILGSQDIVNQLSAGRRRNMWAVIERLAKEEFGSAPDVGAIRTLAVQGNQVFQWIADFDKGTYTDDQFDRLTDAAEAWIIAAASGVEERVGSEDEEPTEEDEFAEFEDELEDSDEDW